MVADAGAYSGPAHPAPARGRVRLGGVFFGLIGGPAAWVTQLIVNYGLASYSCFPRIRPSPYGLPGWHGIWGGLLAINLVAVAVTVAAAWISFRDWHTTRGEHPGHSPHALDAGEGRTRFLALVGIMTALGFVAAIVFDTVALLAVPQCPG